MAPDLKLHLKYGVAVLAYLVVVLLVARHASEGIALALGAAALSWGVERYQAIRREGVASLKDAAHSAAPGVVAGLAWHVVSVLAA